MGLFSGAVFRFRWDHFVRITKLKLVLKRNRKECWRAIFRCHCQVQVGHFVRITKLKLVLKRNRRECWRAIFRCPFQVQVGYFVRITKLKLVLKRNRRECWRTRADNLMFFWGWIIVGGSLSGRAIFRCPFQVQVEHFVRITKNIKIHLVLPANL